MLDKGQGKTLATYQLLLQAFDHEGRVEEAEVLWGKLLGDNQQSIPRNMFAQMIAMYDRYDKKKELLKVNLCSLRSSLVTKAISISILRNKPSIPECVKRSLTKLARANMKRVCSLDKDSCEGLCGHGRASGQT